MPNRNRSNPIWPGLAQPRARPAVLVSLRKITGPVPNVLQHISQGKNLELEEECRDIAGTVDMNDV